MKIEPTGICALGRLRAGNADSEEEIYNLLYSTFLEGVKREWTPSDIGGYTAIICSVVYPGEEKLGEILISLGFFHETIIERRKGYGGGKIALFIKKRLEDEPFFGLRKPFEF